MKNYLVVNGYNHKREDSMNEALAYILNELDEHENLHPALISKTENFIKTFNEVVKATTFIYAYDTMYTETFTVYESETYDPLGEIHHYIKVMQHRKEMQPEVKKQVNELKEWLKENGWKATEVGKENGYWYIRFQPNDYTDSFTIETEERNLCCKNTKDKAFAQQVGVRFMDLDGWFEDILAAF